MSHQRVLETMGALIERAHGVNVAFGYLPDGRLLEGTIGKNSYFMNIHRMMYGYKVQLGVLDNQLNPEVTHSFDLFRDQALDPVIVKTIALGWLVANGVQL